MKLCTTLVQRWQYVEIVPATPSSSAKWGRRYYFDHCGKPAVDSREGTSWCKRHQKPQQSKEDT